MSTMLLPAKFKNSQAQRTAKKPESREQILCIMLKCVFLDQNNKGLSFRTDVKMMEPHCNKLLLPRCGSLNRHFTDPSQQSRQCCSVFISRYGRTSKLMVPTTTTVVVGTRLSGFNFHQVYFPAKEFENRFD